MSSFEGKPSPDNAVDILKQGNLRFVREEMTFPHLDKARRRQAALENQRDHAFATIISCSDSRVPVEAIFDAGIMDLFVVRIAGNLCGADEMASIEYGVLHVNTPLVVVLGHTQCGAITAVTDYLRGRGEAPEKNIQPLCDRIEPVVATVIKEIPGGSGEEIVSRAVEENVFKTVDEVRQKSGTIAGLVRTGQVKVAGAVYDLMTGAVTFISL